MLSEAVYVYTRNADLLPRQSSWLDGLVRFYLIMLKIIDQIIQNKLLVDNRWSSKALKNMDILLSLRFGIFEKSPLGDFLERFEKKSPNQSSCTDLVQCAFGTFGWKIFPGGILS